MFFPSPSTSSTCATTFLPLYCPQSPTMRSTCAPCCQLAPFDPRFSPLYGPLLEPFELSPLPSALRPAFSPLYGPLLEPFDLRSSPLYGPQSPSVRSTYAPCRWKALRLSPSTCSTCGLIVLFSGSDVENPN